MPVHSLLACGWMIGWASVPYDPVWARNYPRRSALMALAGPLSNLLVVVAGILIHSSHFTFFGIFMAWKVFDVIFHPIHLLYSGAGYQ